MTSWVGFGLLAALCAAGVAIFGRVGLVGIDTVLATTLRSVVMAVGLLVVSGVNGNWRGLLDREAGLDGRAWVYIFLAGACGAASWLAYFAALKLGPAGPVAALDRLSLPLVFVLGVWFLGEKPGGQGWVGLALATIGIYLIASDAVKAHV